MNVFCGFSCYWMPISRKRPDEIFVLFRRRIETTLFETVILFESVLLFGNIRYIKIMWLNFLSQKYKNKWNVETFCKTAILCWIVWRKTYLWQDWTIYCLHEKTILQLNEILWIVCFFLKHSNWKGSEKLSYPLNFFEGKTNDEGSICNIFTFSKCVCCSEKSSESWRSSLEKAHLTPRLRAMFRNILVDFVASSSSSSLPYKKEGGKSVDVLCSFSSVIRNKIEIFDIRKDQDRARIVGDSTNMTA